MAMLGVLDSLRLDFAQAAMACSVAVSPWQILIAPAWLTMRVRNTYPMADCFVTVHQQTVSHSKKTVMSDAVLINTGKDCRKVKLFEYLKQAAL